MRVAVSASGLDLDAPVDPRFGRAPYFVLVDPEDMTYEELENPNVSATSGAGIQAAQMLVARGAQVVLTGNLGPKAFQALQAAGIQSVTGVSGTVESAVQRYKTGQYQASTRPNVSADLVRGMGRGRGKGRTEGRHRQGGLGVAPAPSPVANIPQQEPPDSHDATEMVPATELAQLRSQLASVQKQMRVLEERLAQKHQERPVETTT